MATASLNFGAGAGTGPSGSISGQFQDAYGQISLTTGSSPTASTVVCSVNYPISHANAPAVILQSANANAAALSATGEAWATANTSAFSVNIGSTALTAATTYMWNYFIPPS